MEHDFAPPQPSMLMWVMTSLGAKYALGLPLVALICLALVLLLVIRGKGPLAAATIVLLVLAAPMVGLLGMFDGMIQSFTVIGMSPTTPKPAEIAGGIGTALVAPVVAILLSFPAFATAVVGGLIRSLAGNDPPGKSI